MPKYEALDLSHDAVAFTKSKFGRHYLGRLARIQQSHIEAGMNLDYTDSFRANSMSKAAAIAAEIEFFQIAQTIQKSPTMLERLKKKLKGGDPSEDV